MVDIYQTASTKVEINKDSCEEVKLYINYNFNKTDYIIKIHENDDMTLICTFSSHQNDIVNIPPTILSTQGIIYEKVGSISPTEAAEYLRLACLLDYKKLTDIEQQMLKTYVHKIHFMCQTQEALDTTSSI